METNSLLSLDKIPAKSTPFQSVRTHGIVTGIVAQELFLNYLCNGTRKRLADALQADPEGAGNIVGYIASIHDIGKLGGVFQKTIAASCSSECAAEMHACGLLPDYDTEHVRHEVTSKRILHEKIWQRTYDGVNNKSGKLLAAVIGAHHQGHASRKHDFSSKSAWIPYWEQFEQQMAHLFLNGSFSIPVIHEKDHAFVGAVLNGLLIMADWIASGEAFEDAQDFIRQADGIEHIRERAAEFVKISGLDAVPFSAGETFDEALPAFAGRSRPLQRLTENVFRDSDGRASLLLIEAPMGEGKTEAALYAASQMAQQWGKQGIYFALPTAATANQMIGRVADFLESLGLQKNVRLLHSMEWAEKAPAQHHAFSTDDLTARSAVEWLKPKRRALLGSWAVGTVDQAMMAAMFIKYGVLRLLGLTGKVLILDEVHAFDTYMSDILQELLRWCRELEIPVVLLSATLPSEKRKVLLDAYGAAGSESVYPGITCVREDGSAETYCLTETIPRNPVLVQLHNILNDSEKIARLALDLAKDGGCVGVMVNTVKKAQEVYAAVSALQGSTEDLYLFHSKFTAGRRKEIEEKCIQAFSPVKPETGAVTRVKRGILICTQVVEQSIDLDLDALITAAAPIDLVLQRLGRMHRHKATDSCRPALLKEPVLHLLVPEDKNWESDASVYPDCLLQQTKHVLEQTSVIHFPQDLPALVEAGYSPEGVPKKELDSWMKNIFTQERERALAHAVTINPPEDGFEPLKQTVVYDDLEDRGYLSAATRLSEPTTRIALLEKELYGKVARLRNDKGEIPVYDPALAREIMENSLSVRTSDLCSEAPLHGAGLVQFVEIFPTTEGVYASDEIHIRNDNTLGVKIQQNDKES